jgi:hypothetical protein
MHLARHLKGHGAVVEVWAFNGGAPVADMCEGLGIDWRIVPFSWPFTRRGKLRMLFRLVRLLRKASPSVLLPYTMSPNVVCGLIWRFTGARVCVWNQRDAGLHRMGARAERLAVARTPWLVANSQAGADFLEGELSVSSPRVRVMWYREVTGHDAQSRPTR